ncbi:MAG: hypothetical protein ACJARP_001901 [Vicingaceae bacterium]|jgi:hypothetical protein
MKKRINILKYSVLLLLAFLTFGSLTIQAQVIQPVTSNFVIQPPYSIYLSNYFIPGNERMQLTAVFNDFNEPSIDVKLRVSISGNGINLTTKPNFANGIITLNPGANSIDVSILSQYFDFNNFNVSGIDRNQLLRTGALPEGFYTFEIEFLDFQTGRKISNLGIASARLIRNMPPFLTLPSNESATPVIDPQNILFQWQSLSDASINTAYELTLVQVPDGINANDAVNGTGTPILDAEMVNGTVYNYGATNEQLILGYNYAWRVKAYDINNLSIFENDGLSEVYKFTYGFPPNGQIQLTLPADSAVIPKNNLYFQWGGPSNGIAGTAIEYNLFVVEVNAGQTPEQAMLTNLEVILETSPELYSLSGYSYAHSSALKDGQKYAWKATATVTDIEVATSGVQTFSTVPDIEKIYIGTHELILTNLSNPNPNTLAGTGNVKFDNSGTMLPMSFTDLRVRKVAGRWALQSGEIVNDLSKSITIDLPNGIDTATFVSTQVKLGNKGLFLNGVTKYYLPFEADSSFFTTQAGWMIYDSYQLIGSLPLFADKTYELFDPIGYSLNLIAPSRIDIVNNIAAVYLDGKMTLPVQLADADGNRVEMSFAQRKDLNSFTQSNSSLIKDIEIGNETGFLIHPTAYELDFDKIASPINKSSSPEWNGLYVSEYELIHNFQSDHASKLLIANKQTIHNIPAEFATITFEGIDFNLTDDYSTLNETNYANFKGLNGELTALNLNVEKSVLLNSNLLGTSKSTVIGTFDFNYQIALSGDSSQYSSFLFDNVKAAGTTVDLNRQSIHFTNGDLMVADGTFLLSSSSNSDTIPLQFAAIKLSAVGNELKIIDGVAEQTLSNFTITRSSFDLNPTKTKIDKEGIGLFFIGEKWNLPLASEDGVTDIPLTEKWLNYEDFQLKDTLFATGISTFNLLDPAGFALSINDQAYLLLNDKATFSYTGNVLLPKFGTQTTGLTVPFENLASLASIDYTFANAIEITLLDKIGFQVKPKKVSIDLNENSSPGVKSGSDFWKGAYFTQFESVLATDLKEDGTYQLKAEKRSLITSTATKYLFVDNNGFTYKVDGSGASGSTKDSLSYHGFNGELGVYNLFIENSQFKNGAINGSLLVPIISKTKSYGFSANLTTSGFNNAVFEANGIQNQSTTFNSGNAQEVVITVNSANFQNNGDIKFDIGLSFTDYKMDIASLDDFIYNSAGKVGFGSYDGEHILTSQTSGEVGGVFPFVASDIKAKRLKDNIYGFEVNGVVTVADNLSGSSGVIEGGFTSTFSDNSSDIELIKFVKINSDLTTFEINTPVKIELGPVAFESSFSYLQDDPIYGNSVQAFLSLDLKVPTPFNAMGKIVVGEKDGTNYWFAQVGAGILENFPADSALTAQREKAATDAAANAAAMPPPQGASSTTNKTKTKSRFADFKGIPLGPVFLTTFEGRIYHHMNHVAGGSISDADYVPDPNIEFGFFVRIGAVDAVTNGGSFSVDGSIEANFNASGLNVLAIAADVSVGNSATTDGGGGESSESAIQVSGNMTLNIPQERFTATMTANISNESFCASGTFFIDVSPTIFELNVGTEDDKIAITPGCAGWGGQGYVLIDTSKIEVGIGVSFTAEAGTGELGWGPVTFEVDASVGIEGGVIAALEYNPEIRFLKAGIYIKAWASIDVSYFVFPVSGEFNLATASLSGDLTLYFEPRKRLKGDLKGNLSILDGTFVFDFELPINEYL